MLLKRPACWRLSQPGLWAPPLPPRLLSYLSHGGNRAHRGGLTHSRDSKGRCVCQGEEVVRGSCRAGLSESCFAGLQTLTSEEPQHSHSGR